MTSTGRSPTPRSGLSGFSSVSPRPVTFSGDRYADCGRFASVRTESSTKLTRISVGSACSQSVTGLFGKAREHASVPKGGSRPPCLREVKWFRILLLTPPEVEDRRRGPHRPSRRLPTEKGNPPRHEATVQHAAGTRGGFQPVVLEYSCNVVGFRYAQHAEQGKDASLHLGEPVENQTRGVVGGREPVADTAECCMRDPGAFLDRGVRLSWVGNPTALRREQHACARGFAASARIV